MKVLIQKPDLDTCLAALILGVQETNEVICLNGEASETDLGDPHVLCIEAGGSGQAVLMNFDHHDPVGYFPPACRQAYEAQGWQDDGMLRLVDYVCLVDERPADHPRVAFPSLSNLFSGMLLVEKDAVTQFLAGMALLRTVRQDGLDPFVTMPDRDEWRPWRLAKEENLKMVMEASAKARFNTTQSGLRIGFLESNAVGGTGTLFAQGCRVAILFNPTFGVPPLPKYTIAGNGVAVSGLLPHLDRLEKGWGGRETIIGSPRLGSVLTPAQVVEQVLKHL